MGRSCRAIRSDVEKSGYFVKESLSVSKVHYKIWICSLETVTHAAGPEGASDGRLGSAIEGIFAALCTHLVFRLGYARCFD